MSLLENQEGRSADFNSETTESARNSMLAASGWRWRAMTELEVAVMVSKKASSSSAGCQVDSDPVSCI